MSSSPSPSSSEEKQQETFLTFEYDLPINTLTVLSDDLTEMKQFCNQNTIILIGIGKHQPCLIIHNFIIHASFQSPYIKYFYTLLDTERHPYDKKKITTLFQIALRNNLGEEHVYLVDLMIIPHNQVFATELDCILLPLMESKTIIKIGQGLTQDFNELHNSYNNMKSFSICNSILETNTIHQYLNPKITYNISLRNLTRNYLHFDLDKTCQMSNWKARPLSEQQVTIILGIVISMLYLYIRCTCISTYIYILLL